MAQVNEFLFKPRHSTKTVVCFFFLFIYLITVSQFSDIDYPAVYSQKKKNNFQISHDKGVFT